MFTTMQLTQHSYLKYLQLYAINTTVIQERQIHGENNYYTIVLEEFAQQNVTMFPCFVNMRQTVVKS